MEGLLALAALLFATPQEPIPEARRARVAITQSPEHGHEVVPGLAVSLGWSDGSRMQTLRELALDELGRAEVELALPDEAGERPQLWARVDAPGFQRHERWARFEAYGKPLQLWLPVVRGGTLVGVARAEPSHAHGRAKLRLVPADGRAVAPAFAVAGDEGRFVLHFAEPGRYHLMASWGERGLAIRRDLALDPADAPGEFDLALELAPGLDLAGRVVDPDGEPVFRFSLSILPEGFALATDDEIREREWSFLGTLGARVTTDQDGRFAFHGLPPGRYAFVGSEAGTVRVLGSELLAAGASDARVEARVHRVELQVRRDSGVLVPLGTLVRDDYGREPGDPLLVLTDDDRAYARRTIDGLTAHLWTDAGREVRYAYASARDPLVEGRLVVPASPWLVRAELRLGPPVEPAVLTLRLLGGQGEPWIRSALVLESETGVDVGGGYRFGGSGCRVRVPPGRYVARVVPSVDLMCGNAPLDDFVSPLAPAEAEVELVAGEETSLELVLHPNARLAVVLALPRAGATEEIEAALRSDDYREPLRRALHGARVELARLPRLARLDGGRPIAPEFRVELSEHELGEVRAAWIAPGRECVSLSGLAPGAHRLTATLHDGRVLEHTVELIGGVTTSVLLAPE